MKGLSLIEVIIASLIVSIALLGLLGAHNLCLQTLRDDDWQYSAYEQWSILEERLLKPNLLGLNTEIKNWIEEVKTILPGGDAKVAQDTVTIYWRSRSTKSHHLECLNLPLFY